MGNPQPLGAEMLEIFSGYTPWILELTKPIHVAAYIEHFMETHSKPTTKQHLAAIRMLSTGSLPAK